MKDINEHNQTINEINLLIESNLNESNYDDFLTFIRGGERRRKKRKRKKG